MQWLEGVIPMFPGSYISVLKKGLMFPRVLCSPLLRKGPVSRVLNLPPEIGS